MLSHRCNPYASKAQSDFEIAVKIELVKRRMTVKKLAEDIGISRPVVSNAINQPLYPTVKAKIAEYLELELEVPA